MNLAFTLTMPGRNTWNGKWSGDDKLWCKVERFVTPTAMQRAHLIAAKKRYSYDFGDGWYAAITVRIVLAPEARRLQKQSAGFCGYDWMVDSIIADGDIYGPKKPKPEKEIVS